MQSNSSAGIISYRETKTPQVLSMLALPKLEAHIVMAGETQNISIYIFDCPIIGDKLDKRRYKMLRGLVDDNKVKFLVERFNAKVESNVSPRKDELHYTQLISEIKAMKQLAALIKLSQDKSENLLSGNISFIMGEVDLYKIDLLSEDASNVMIYESASLTEGAKLKLHNDFMEKKGVSIIFTKDIHDIIMNSSVISTDETVDLSEFSELLQDKIVLGKTKHGAIKGIDNIILWTEELDKSRNEKIPVIYNDEILAILRYYQSKLDIIEFIKRLPYIYLDYKIQV